MKDRRLKIMWNSNALWALSGYGVYQRDLLPRLAADGWQVAQSAFYGLEGSVIDYKGVKVYPKMVDTWGGDGMVRHAQHFGADVVFSMQDVWPLDPNLLNQIKRWIPYVPIDGDPVPPLVLDRLRYAYKIISFSEFGYNALKKHNFSSTLILEATDPDIFYPMDKGEARKQMGLPQDKFIFGMVGANKPDAYSRKGWQQALDAFKIFHEKHPDSIFFHQTNQPGGFPIMEYAGSLGLADYVYFIKDPYLAVFHCESDQMRKLYNSFDVLLHPSTTEGFGLCSVEAMSCGVPPIVSNCTSLPEQIRPETGEICDIAQTQWTQQNTYIHIPSTKSIVEKMEVLYNCDRKKRGENCRNLVLEKYNINKSVQEKWIPMLEQLQLEILGEPPKTDLTNLTQESKLNTDSK